MPEQRHLLLLIGVPMPHSLHDTDLDHDEHQEDSDIQELDLNNLTSTYDDEDEDSNSEKVQVKEDDVAVFEKGKMPKMGYNVRISNEDLILYIRAGIEPKKCKELLVQYNLGLIMNEARRSTCFIPFEDLVQYGVMGFMMAVESYDLSQGLFSTYATTSVYQCINRYSNRDMRNVHIPEYLSCDNAKLIKFMRVFEQKHNRLPDTADIMEGTDLSEHRIKVLKEFVMPKYVSTDMPYGTDDNASTFGSKLKGMGLSHHLDVENLDSDKKDTIDLILDGLDDNERILVAMVHGLDDHEPHTLEEISKSQWANTLESSSTSTLSRRYHDVLNKIRKNCKLHKITFSFLEDADESYSM